jgi:hypothetical protein
MNPYEQMIKTIREQGKSGSSKGMRIGVMKSASVCMIDTLELDEDDLLVAQHLVTGYQSKDGYVNPLKKGDTVLIQRINEEQYAIIERLVEL